MFGSRDDKHSHRPTVDELLPLVEKIDVTLYIGEMERGLRGSSPLARHDALAILRRWQFDAMLTDESRVRATILVKEFGEAAPSEWALP